MKDIQISESIKLDYYKAVSIAIASASGFLTALLWRDTVVAFLRRCGIWGDRGIETAVDGLKMIMVSIVATVIAAAVAVFITRWAFSHAFY